MRNPTFTLSLLLLAFAVSPVLALPSMSYAERTASPPSGQNKPSLYEQGLIALDNKRLAEAEKLFRQAAEKEPASPAPLIGLAEVARINKNGAEAERWIRKASEVAPNHVDSHLALGRLLYAKGMYGQAEQHLLKAAAIAPNSAVPPLDLGELYLNALHKPELAVQFFRKAANINAGHAGAHFGLGNAYLALRDYPNAIQSLTEASRLAPDNPLPLIALSDAQAARGDTNGAFASLRAAAKLAPKVAGIPLKMGMLYQQTEQWTEAMAEYEQAIRLDNKLAVAYNNFAWISAERKTRLEEGARRAAQAVELAPAVTNFKDTFAWVKRAQGDHKGALDLLETVAKGSNPPAETWYHLGIVRAEAGQKTQAVVALKRALELDAKFPQARDARERIKQLGSR